MLEVATTRRRVRKERNKEDGKERVGYLISLSDLRLPLRVMLMRF